MNKTVYLAGPILGKTYEEANAWREQARATLEPDGITGVSPLRGKSFLSEKGVLEKDVCRQVLATEQAIVTRDYFDVSRCAVLLANFVGAGRASIGTCFELAWAYAQHKPAVVVMPKGNVHDHAFVRRATGFRVDSLEKAADVIRHILLVGGA